MEKNIVKLIKNIFRLENELYYEITEMKMNGINDKQLKEEFGEDVIKNYNQKVKIIINSLKKNTTTYKLSLVYWIKCKKSCK